MNPFISLIFTVIDIYFWIIIAVVASSWLIQFGIINYSNPTVRQVLMGLRALTEPVLGPVRRMLPNLGGLDISPIVVLLGLQFLKQFIGYYIAPMLG
jgi:YggT family protein